MAGVSSASTVNSANSGRVVINGLGSGLDTAGVISALTQAENKQILLAQGRESALQQKLALWQQVNVDLVSLANSTSSLGTESNFESATAVSSNSSLATVKALSGAASGTHTLKVSALAQNHQLLSGSQQSSGNPLGYSGSIDVNGKIVRVASSDTLEDIAASINKAGASVNAKVLTISSGNVQLSITATQPGSINAISLSDLDDGGVLQKLGLVSDNSAANSTLRQSVNLAGSAKAAVSIGVPSALTKLSTSFESVDKSKSSEQTIKINGSDVKIDFANMSLTDVANTVNSAKISGVSAQIVSVPDQNGDITPTSLKQLQIISSKGDLKFDDSGATLSRLGITQPKYLNQAAAAQDSKFSVDDIEYTRSTNTVNDVIPKVDITLLSTSAQTQKTDPSQSDSKSDSTIITVSQGTDTVVSSVQAMVSAYNKVNDFINQQNTFDAPKGASGMESQSPPLFGDYTLIDVQQQLVRSFSNSFAGKGMSDVGLTLDAKGNLSLDSSKLTGALQNDPKSVYKLFGSTGVTTGANVSFISAGVSTRESSGIGYAIKIDQPASAGKITAINAQTAPSDTPETLTFSGRAFNSGPIAITIPAGSSQKDLVDLINGNSSLNQSIFANIDSDSKKLTFVSKGYGSSNSFAVLSDQSASASNSGIGKDSINGDGTDVKGTIGGEPAVGIGQTLSSLTSNKNTAGIVLKVTGTGAGDYGAVRISHGAADTIKQQASRFTTGNTSAVMSAENTINGQIKDIESQVKEMRTQLQKYTDSLTQQFNDMEKRVSTLNAQQKALNTEITAASGMSGGGGKSNNQ
jgi:flagellar hook-associated protein 2